MNATRGSEEAATHNVSAVKVSETSETRLVSFLDSIGDAVIVADLAGSVEFLNLAAKILIGVGAGSAIGRPLDELLHLEESGTGRRLSNLAELAFISGSSISLGRDLIMVTRGGQSVQVEGEVAARVLSGRPTGAVVTLRDVTARNWEDGRRREKWHLQTIGQLAASVAHEVNNLLTVVFGHSELLEKRPLPDSAAANVAAIRKAAEGMAGVTRQLLGLSGKEILFPASVDINDLLAASESRLRAVVPAHLTLNLSLAAGLGPVLVDSSKLVQALVDLVRHACSRMNPGGVVTVSTRHVAVETNCRARHARHYVEVSVQDEGLPIRGPAADELFEPTLKSTPGRPFTLGLFNVRNLASASSGHLYLQNGVEAGARVVLLFPQYKDECPVLGPEPASDGQARPTILLVEDDDAIRILLSNTLEAKGYQVIEARDGEEALMQSDIFEASIGLLITDVAMPRVDGPSLARALQDKRPGIGILMISGCVGDLEAIRELLDGGAHYFQKPFSQAALMEWVEANLPAKEVDR